MEILLLSKKLYNHRKAIQEKSKKAMMKLLKIRHKLQMMLMERKKPKMMKAQIRMKLKRRR